MKTEEAILVLSDGSVFNAEALAWTARSVGELVCFTDLVGYQEALTDANNSGKIILFTTPHIGNTGVNGEDAQGSITAGGLIFREPMRVASNFRAESTLEADLESNAVATVVGVDTRAIARKAAGQKLRAGIFTGADLELSKEELLEIVTTTKDLGA